MKVLSVALLAALPLSSLGALREQPGRREVFSHLCGPFTTALIGLSHDHASSADEPLAEQAEVCATLRDQDFVSPCKALVGSYGLAPVQHLVMFRPDVVCGHLVGLRTGLPGESAYHDDGGATQSLLAAAAVEDDDEMLLEDDNGDKDSDEQLLWGDSEDKDEDKDSVEDAPADETSAMRLISSVKPTASVHHDDDDDDDDEEEDRDEDAKEAELELSDRLGKEDKMWGNAKNGGNNRDGAKAPKASKPRKETMNIARMKKVVADSIKMLPLQHHMIRMRMMEEAANTAGLLHNIAMSQYLADPTCIDKDDVSCQTQSLMDGMSYLSSETMNPNGGLFGASGAPN